MVVQVAGDNGIGRVDIVESRFVGMKSRGVYETPGGTILLTARRAIESITLDRGELHLKVGAFGYFVNYIPISSQAVCSVIRSLSASRLYRYRCVSESLAKL